MTKHQRMSGTCLSRSPISALRTHAADILVHVREAPEPLLE